MSPAPAKAKAGLWPRINGWTYGPTIGVTLLVGAAFNLWLLPLLDFAGPKATFLAATLGLLVGVVELVKRYRDEPVNAVLSPWGLIYLLVNALISLVALYLVYLFPAVFGGLAQNKPLAALAAGAGAAAIMRTRIALFKGADGKDLALPLDYLINELLSLADKHIDRHRAANRRELVESHMDDIRELGSFKEAADYLLASLLAFQRDQKEQREELNQLIASYEKLPLPDDIKYLALGFTFLSLVGEAHYAAVIDSAAEIAKAKKPIISVVTGGSPPPTAPPPPGTPPVPGPV